MVTCPHRRVYHTFMGSRFRVSKNDARFIRRYPWERASAGDEGPLMKGFRHIMVVESVEVIGFILLIVLLVSF